MIQDEAGKDAIVIAEQHADQAQGDKLSEARRRAEGAAAFSWGLWDDGTAEALEAASAAAGDDPQIAANQASGYAASAAQSAADGDPSAWKAEQRRQCNVLRDLFANPLQPRARIDPSWLEGRRGIVLDIAQSIYERCRFEELPILADALEDAGCTDRAILEHLRGPGPHFKGCWCLDLLLTRE
jgi:hypothetical protein